MLNYIPIISLIVLFSHSANSTINAQFETKYYEKIATVETLSIYDGQKIVIPKSFNDDKLLKNYNEIWVDYKNFDSACNSTYNLFFEDNYGKLKNYISSDNNKITYNIFDGTEHYNKTNFLKDFLNEIYYKDNILSFKILGDHSFIIKRKINIDLNGPAVINFRIPSNFNIYGVNFKYEKSFLDHKYLEYQDPQLISSSDNFNYYQISFNIDRAQLKQIYIFVKDNNKFVNNDTLQNLFNINSSLSSDSTNNILSVNKISSSRINHFIHRDILDISPAYNNFKGTFRGIKINSGCNNKISAVILANTQLVYFPAFLKPISDFLVSVGGPFLVYESNLGEVEVPIIDSILTFSNGYYFISSHVSSTPNEKKLLENTILLTDINLARYIAVKTDVSNLKLNISYFDGNTHVTKSELISNNQTLDLNKFKKFFPISIKFPDDIHQINNSTMFYIFNTLLTSFPSSLLISLPLETSADLYFQENNKIKSFIIPNNLVKIKSFEAYPKDDLASSKLDLKINYFDKTFKIIPISFSGRSGFIDFSSLIIDESDFKYVKSLDFIPTNLRKITLNYEIFDTLINSTIFNNRNSINQIFNNGQFLDFIPLSFSLSFDSLNDFDNLMNSTFVNYFNVVSFVDFSNHPKSNLSVYLKSIVFLFLLLSFYFTFKKFLSININININMNFIFILSFFAYISSYYLYFINGLFTLNIFMYTNFISCFLLSLCSFKRFNIFFMLLFFVPFLIPNYKYFNNDISLFLIFNVLFLIFSKYKYHD